MMPRAGLAGRFLLLPGALVLASAACRSAGGPAPATPPGPLADAGRALVGQQRILRFHGLKRELSLKMADVARQSGPCDVAVEVKSAVFTSGSARFSLQPIGQPRPEPPQRRSGKSPCRVLPAEVSLSLSGLQGSSPEKLTAEVGRVLLTAEGYLETTKGVRIDRPAGKDPKDVADATLTAEPDEQRLARAVTSGPRRLLAVDPVQRSANRKVRYEGQVEFVAVVATDGRLHKPRVTTSLGDYEEQVLRVLPLWRYEPARRGDEPVAVRLTEKTVLRISY
jgi:hypothetical protein